MREHHADTTDTLCRYCELDRLEAPIAHSAAGFAVPSIGAMVEGWSIVFPRRHVLSLAQLDDHDWSAFDDLVQVVRDNVERYYGKAVLFEHGSAGSGRPAACGVDHAHLHVVPLDLPLRELITAVLESGSWARVDTRVPPVVGMDYIYVDDASGRWVAYQPWLPSQVARQAVAAYLGLSDWDWKASPNLHLVEATRRALRAAA